MACFSCVPEFELFFNYLKLWIMSRLSFILAVLFVVSIPTALLSITSIFNTGHSIEVTATVNGVQYVVPLYASGQNCPSPGLGLLTISSATGQAIHTAPVSPTGSYSSLTYGEIIIIGSLTYGEIIIIGSLTSQTVYFTYTYGGCTYSGSIVI